MRYLVGLVLVYMGMRTMGANHKAGVATVMGLAALKWGRRINGKNPKDRGLLGRFVANWLGLDRKRGKETKRFAREGLKW